MYVRAEYGPSPTGLIELQPSGRLGAIMIPQNTIVAPPASSFLGGIDFSTVLIVGLGLLAGAFLLRNMQLTAPAPKVRKRRSSTKYSLGTILPYVAGAGLAGYVYAKYLSGSSS